MVGFARFITHILHSLLFIIAARLIFLLGSNDYDAYKEGPISIIVGFVFLLLTNALWGLLTQICYEEQQ